MCKYLSLFKHNLFFKSIKVNDTDCKLMEANNMEEKQKYLRENILESGYDPSDFVSFL